MREKAKLKQAKALRKDMTDAEQLLWFRLRAKRFYGLKFLRQSLVEGFIPDFVCKHPPIIIELDGGQHAIQKAADDKRDDSLRSRGYMVLRFWNNDVLSNMDGVLSVTKHHVDCSPLPHPSPVHGRGALAATITGAIHG